MLSGLWGYQPTFWDSCHYLVETLEKLWIKVIQGPFSTPCKDQQACELWQQEAVCDPGSGKSPQTMVSILNLFS